jgi:RNA-binding protein YhbY
MDIIQIGKKGLTSTVLSEIKARLKAKGLIKIKVLKCVKAHFNEILSTVLGETKAKLVKKIGFTFVLKRKE